MFSVSTSRTPPSIQWQTGTGKELKGLAIAGLITPETIVDAENGKSAPARKVKGLTFLEPKTFIDPFHQIHGVEPLMQLNV